MRISLKSLKYFLVAVESGNITQAAEKLNVVPSAVWTAIRQVESELDLKLINRVRSKGISSTTTGRVVADKIQHLLEEYDNFLLEGADLSKAISGTIRIGYYAPIAPAFIPAIVAPILRENPEVNIKFTECDNQDAQNGLLNGNFDTIIFVSEKVKPGIAYETLTEVPAYLLISKNHRLADNSNLTLSDLADEPLILLDLPVISEYYGELLDKAQIKAKVNITATTIEMVRSLVSSGAGCSILNMQPFTDTSYTGEKLKAIPFNPPLKSLNIVVGYLQGKRRRLVDRFIEECRDYFKEGGSDALTITNSR